MTIFKPEASGSSRHVPSYSVAKRLSAASAPQTGVPRVIQRKFGEPSNRDFDRLDVVRVLSGDEAIERRSHLIFGRRGGGPDHECKKHKRDACDQASRDVIAAPVHRLDLLFARIFMVRSPCPAREGPPSGSA